MITISKVTRHLHEVKTSELGQDNLGKFDHNKRMITLSVITLSDFHCGTVNGKSDNNKQLITLTVITLAASTALGTIVYSTKHNIQMSLIFFVRSTFGCCYHLVNGITDNVINRLIKSILSGLVSSKLLFNTWYTFLS
jgi:hypothetical protein